MSARNKSIHFRINGDTWTFDQIQARAQARLDEQSGDFWARVALILLKRIYELEREAQDLRQGELFAPHQIQRERGAT